MSTALTLPIPRRHLLAEWMFFLVKIVGTSTVVFTMSAVVPTGCYSLSNTSVTSMKEMETLCEGSKDANPTSPLGDGSAPAPSGSKRPANGTLSDDDDGPPPRKRTALKKSTRTTIQIYKEFTPAARTKNGRRSTSDTSTDNDEAPALKKPPGIGPSRRVVKESKSYIEFKRLYVRDGSRSSQEICALQKALGYDASTTGS
ncbi:hypothetical protein C8J57DRAFT_1520802 [Mycena rebaudengoi]|nr:hypothetical protein C8J57DRAFT_1520802 [Mycena rebaudengoi]